MSEATEPVTACPCCTHNMPPGTASGWHQRKGPLPLLRTRHGQPSTDEWWHPRWTDHSYRVRLEDGRWRYVTEPYSLHERDVFADLAFLVEQGYDVAVTATNALHFPGHTVAVEITPPRRYSLEDVAAELGVDLDALEVDD